MIPVENIQGSYTAWLPLISMSFLSLSSLFFFFPLIFLPQDGGHEARKDTGLNMN